MRCIDGCDPCVLIVCLFWKEGGFDKDDAAFVVFDCGVRDDEW